MLGALLHRYRMLQQIAHMRLPEHSFCNPSFSPQSLSRSSLARPAPVSQHSSRMFDLVAHRPLTVSALEMAQEQPQTEYEEDKATIGSATWAPELTNSVSVIGRLGGQAILKQTPIGEVTVFSVAISQGRTKAPLWLDVEVWGPLGQSAAELLRGEQVNIMGRLGKKYPKAEQGEKQYAYKLIAKEIDRISGSKVFHDQETQMPDQAESETQLESWADIQGSSEMQSEYNQASPSPSDYAADRQPPVQASGNYQARNAEKDQKWADFFENRNQYWDNRTSKLKPNQPDFKHKSTGDALWLNYAPNWVKERLDTPE